MTSFDPQGERRERLEAGLRDALHALGFAEPEQIVGAVEWVALQRGEPLFDRGDAGDAMYVVLSGQVQMLAHADDGSEFCVATLGSGELFGELSLLTGEARSATARARKRAELARIDRGAFERTLAERPAVLASLARLVAHRLRDPYARSGAPPIETIAILASGPAVSAVEFARGLQAALGLYRRAGLVRRADLPPEIVHDLDRSAIVGWLENRESEGELLLLCVEADEPQWAAGALEAADRALFVVRPETEPSARLPDRSGAAAEPPTTLIVAHPGSFEPSRTSRWLATGRFSDHDHVRSAVPGDLERLARLLAGEWTGLVLSGGGARALVHIGVLRALEEVGIPVDRIGGTSFGAVIAADHAMGFDAGQLLERNRVGWKQVNGHFTLPLLSAWSSRRLRRRIRQAFGSRNFEELPLDCYCAVTNLSTGELEIRNRGSVARWVRASMSPPGLWPPVVGDDGDLLVDGGVLDNLPVEPMLERGPGRLIVSNASPEKPLRVLRGVREPDTGLQEAIRRVRRPDAKFPPLSRLLYQTAVVTSMGAKERALEVADIVVQPEIEGFGLADYDRIDEIAERGYRAARAALEGALTGPDRGEA